MFDLYNSEPALAATHTHTNVAEIKYKSSLSFWKYSEKHERLEWNGKQNRNWQGEGEEEGNHIRSNLAAQCSSTHLMPGPDSM